MVVDSDNALHVLDLVGDVVAQDEAPRGSGKRDDAVFNGHREAARVGEEAVRDDILSDLAPDLLIRPAVHAEHVRPADDAD